MPPQYLPTFTTRPVILGTHGVVAAGHYTAAAVGMDVLSRGGNAIDAGVAAAFTLTLVKPQECGMGGECPILIYRTTSGDGPNPVAISGQGAAPRQATPERFRAMGMDAVPGQGLLPATVPATFGSLVTALMLYGRLTLADTLGPVVEMANDGYPLYPSMRAVIEEIRDLWLRDWPSTADVFLAGRDVPPVGSLVRQPVWSSTFRAILDVETRNRSHGREMALQACLDAFYRGRVAQDIAAFARDGKYPDEYGRVHAGLLESADFADHRTRVESPVTVRYRGLDVHKCPPWSQGPVFLQQLALLEGFDLAALGHNSPAYVHTVVEAAKLAFADRNTYYGDPAFVDVPLDRLLGTAYNDARRALIDPGRASGELRPGDGLWTPDIPPPVRAGRGDTTHVDVVDAAGNMFSATPSGGWFQSSPVVPAVGFPLGTRAQQFTLRDGHPNVLAPGKRPRTTLTPSLVTLGGQPRMVFGTEGGDNQDQWSLQFFLNVVEFDMNLQEAVDAPLFHTLHFPSSFFPHESRPLGLVVEDRLPIATRDALASLGHEIEVADGWSSGHVTAIRFTPATGLIEGAASPRTMTAYAIGR
jgi:gamma-glutamyltranspeptidase/glutathione hydrolase